MNLRISLLVLGLNLLLHSLVSQRLLRKMANLSELNINLRIDVK